MRLYVYSGKAAPVTGLHENVVADPASSPIARVDPLRTLLPAGQFFAPRATSFDRQGLVLARLDVRVCRVATRIEPMRLRHLTGKPRLRDYPRARKRQAAILVRPGFFQAVSLMPPSIICRSLTGTHPQGLTSISSSNPPFEGLGNGSVL